MRQLTLMTIVITFVVGGASLAGAGEYHEATTGMAQLGAETFWSEASGPRNHVEFIGTRGDELAVVEVDAADLGALRVEISAFSDGTEKVVLVWDQVHGTLRVQGPGSTKTFESRYNFQTRSWEGDPGIDKFERRFSREIAFAGLALDATLGKGNRAQPKISQPACGGGSVIPGSEISGVLIDCDGFRCRGFGTSGSASNCCEEAWQEASNCCTNGLCWGCCRFLSCDKGCGFGDYFCFCGVTGVSCSHPAY